MSELNDSALMLIIRVLVVTVWTSERKTNENIQARLMKMHASLNRGIIRLDKVKGLVKICYGLFVSKYEKL